MHSAPSRVICCKWPSAQQQPAHSNPVIVDLDDYSTVIRSSENQITGHDGHCIWELIQNATNQRHRMDCKNQQTKMIKNKNSRNKGITFDLVQTLQLGDRRKNGKREEKWILLIDAVHGASID